MNASLTHPDPAKAREYFSDKMEFTTGPVELKRELDAGNVVVVDVRDPDDYARGHIPGAISYPRDRWDRPAALSRDKTNVVYCYSQVCHLAATIAIRLAGDGFPVRELEGGFASWREHELPVATGAPAAGQDDAANVAYGSNRDDDRANRNGANGAGGSPAPKGRSPRQENL